MFILIVLLIIAALSSPAFLTGTNITNLLLQMSIIGVVVMAELIIVLTGGIDISVGSVLGLAAVLCAGLFGGFSVWFALLVRSSIGGVIGASQRLVGLVPRPRTVHRDPGHAGVGSWPGIRLWSGHPDHARRRRTTFAQIGQTTVVGIPVLTLIWIAVVLIDRVPAEEDGVGTPGVCDR